MKNLSYGTSRGGPFPLTLFVPPAKPLSAFIGLTGCQSPRRAFYWLRGGRSEARGKEKGSGAGAEGRERPVRVWPLPLLSRGLQAGLRLSPRLRGTVCEAPPGQRGRAAGGGRRIMSAKDERAREILRGFKLYPPGSGAGPGGLGRRPLAVETGWGWGPRQVGTRREAAGGRKERRPGPPTGPGAGGGARGVLMEEGDVAWSLGGCRRRSPGIGLREVPDVGNGCRGGQLGSQLRSAP